MKRIAICASNSITLAGLTTIIDREPQFEVAGSFLNTDSLSSLEDCDANLLIIESTRLLDRQLEQWLSTTDWQFTGILLEDSLVIEEIQEYLAWGFLGFLPRSPDANEIIVTINTVLVGLMVIHPDLALQLDTPGITPWFKSEIYLTPRETEILQLLGEGLDNKAIANYLHISKHTVKFHISSIFSKLDVSSRIEAVTLGLKQGLIRL